MSFEIVCDVDGCEERAPLGERVGPMQGPAGWSTLIVQMKRSEDVSPRMRHMMRKFPRMAPMPMMGDALLSATEVRIRHCNICPKHELPDLKKIEEDEEG